MNELSDLKSFLDEKVEQYNGYAFIETDPIQIPKKFTSQKDIEIAGFLTATIAWGNRTAIIKNANKLMELMEFDPYNFVVNSSETEIDRLNDFVHRTFNGKDCTYFIRSLKNIYKNHIGLKSVFEKGFGEEHTIHSALTHFYHIFFEKEGERTRKHISNVQKGASGKRLNMFLRWMVRNDKNNVDFGIWDTIPQSKLMLPLDVHTANIGRKLGLLKRRSNDWKAVEELTSVLREFDPNDPIKYDFALFGLGAFEKF